jgi:glyoxylase-like metal-dependent hydrolase (beta-lactamase superfamily II)
VYTDDQVAGNEPEGGLQTPTPNSQPPTPLSFRPDPPTAPLHRLEIRTPFAVGTANVYVVEDDPLTLVDTGPNTPEAWADLEAGLAGLGYGVSDVGRILITHGHVDHWGQAGRVAAASGAAVWAHRLLEPWLRDPVAEATRRLAFSTLLCGELGVPPGEMVAINRGIKWVAGFAGPAPIAGLWDDGDEVLLGGAPWEVIHTPGHAPSHVCFYQPALRALIAGDHLLGEITSNPVIEAPPSGSTVRPRSLPDYLHSLERVAALRVLWVYPGHGAPFQGHRKLIKERLAFHERRLEKIAGFLAEGPTSVYDLSHRLFPNLEGVNLFLGLSETLGHLDLLEDRGRVTITHAGRVLHYSLKRDA